MTYSQMLKEILTASHWTQEQLAAKLGVSFATVNSWINERTEPQKSLAPEIQKLYLAQDVTNEPEPIYITLVENDTHDDETIRVYYNDNKDSLYNVYVANSVNTVIRGTRSAGRIYDKFDMAARAQVMFVFKNMAIARVVNWNVE